MTTPSDDTRGDQMVSGLAAINDALETDKRFAWLVVAGALLAIAACWYVALFVPEFAFAEWADGESATRGQTLRMIVFLVVAAVAPFEGTYAAWYALGTSPGRTDSEIVSSFELQARTDRQRRILLTSALAAVVHLCLLFLALR